jgi:YegS/Rv2252/BmrU family lipid kinase
MIRIALLANPGAGGGDAHDVAAELRRRGAEVHQLPLQRLETALALRPDRIVVAGGDGSLAGPAAAAGPAGIPLAVIPVGTANDFARHLGIPSDVGAACELALRGRARPLDLGRVDGRPFLNAASVGLAAAAARAARRLKGALGSPAYVLGAAWAGLSARPFACVVHCDGERWFAGDAWQVTVACTGAFGAGSSVGADPRDARLDAVVMAAGSRARLLRHAWGLRRGTLAEQPGAAKRRCARARLELPGRMTFNVDGELVESASPEFWVEPGAVRVVTP